MRFRIQFKKAFKNIIQIKTRNGCEPGVDAQACHINPGEAEAGASLGLGQPGLNSKTP